MFQVLFLISIIFLFSAKSGGGGAKKWWGRGPTSPSPSAVPATNAAARRLCRPPRRLLSQVCIMFANRPFYRYGCHIEFIRFKEYYGMPRGHSLSIHARFSGKKRTSLYIFISGKRRSLLNPNTTQRSFFPITIFF